jgi:hypothetical protein
MGKSGTIIKSIGVFSNDPEKRNERLTLEATIKPIFSLLPSGIVELSGKKGEMKRVEVIISTGLDKPFQLKPDRFTLEGKISYTIETLKEGKQYRVVFRNNPEIQGNYMGVLRLRTSYKEKPQINIKVDSRFN